MEQTFRIMVLVALGLGGASCGKNFECPHAIAPTVGYVDKMGSTAGKTLDCTTEEECRIKAKETARQRRVDASLAYACDHSRRAQRLEQRMKGDPEPPLRRVERAARHRDAESNALERKALATARSNGSDASTVEPDVGGATGNPVTTAPPPRLVVMVRHAATCAEPGRAADDSCTFSATCTQDGSALEGCTLSTQGKDEAKALADLLKDHLACSVVAQDVKPATLTAEEVVPDAEPISFESTIMMDAPWKVSPANDDSCTSLLVVATAAELEANLEAHWGPKESLPSAEELAKAHGVVLRLFVDEHGTVTDPLVCRTNDGPQKLAVCTPDIFEREP